MESIVSVKELRKEFTYATKKEKKRVVAVDSISFEVKKGEALGFIGPNGAGKSTTIKMLTGILYPTSGEVSVAGLSPSEQRQSLSYRIGCVFGQRSQLLYNLPPRDSLELFGRLYGVEERVLKNRVDELIHLLALEEFITQPVRKLSLGQRMRAEIACSLVHDPEIIFLDEPTIGLDVVAKRNLREVLATLNKEKGTTLFLTSHDMGDIEFLCERTIIINHGKIVVDEPTAQLEKLYAKTKMVVVDFEGETTCKEIEGTKVLGQTPTQVQLEVDLTKVSINCVLQDIMASYKVADIDIDKPSLETIIGSIYERKEDV
jgi:ABC-2 type transport system ATP-binding protein